MKRLRVIAGAAVVAAALVGCGGSSQTTTLGTNNAYGSDGLGTNTMQQQQTVAKATEALTQGVAPQLTSGINQFGLDLFQKVAKAQPAANLCISPVSISTVMSVLYNGTAGDTQKEIADALKVNKMKAADINDANKNLSAMLTNVDPKKVDLNVANSIWINATTPISTAFLQKKQQYYTAKVATLDFTSPAAPSYINDWAKDNTGGKIPQIVSTLPSNAALYVVNAVYFKGSWQKPFDKTLTSNRDFSLADGTKTQVPTMQQTGSFNYFTNSEVTGLALPYGTGRLEMDVLLPKTDLAQLEKKLTNSAVSSWMKGAKNQSVALTLPTFQSTFSMTLNDTLKSLGLTAAFDPNKADFTPMVEKSNAPSTGQKLFLSEVKHKTYIEVNELGTEAAATTTGQISTTAVMANPVHFDANKPFVYLIRDSQTGVILFSGTVINPLAKSADGDKKPDEKVAQK